MENEEFLLNVRKVYLNRVKQLKTELWLVVQGLDTYLSKQG